MALTKGGREAKRFEREKQSNLHKETLLIKKCFEALRKEPLVVSLAIM